MATNRSMQGLLLHPLPSNRLRSRNGEHLYAPCQHSTAVTAWMPPVISLPSSDASRTECQPSRGGRTRPSGTPSPKLLTFQAALSGDQGRPDRNGRHRVRVGFGWVWLGLSDWIDEPGPHEHSGLCEVKHCGDVGTKGVIPLLIRDLVQRLVRALDAALLTRMSRRSNSDTAQSIIARQWAPLRGCRTPAASTWLAGSLASALSCSLGYLIRMSAPSRAYAMATARPMPLSRSNASCGAAFMRPIWLRLRDFLTSRRPRWPA